MGAYAEYICLREHPKTGAIATMPANLGYEEAAAVPYGGGEALEFLRKANVRSGQRVLVNGAGGSFGTFAVQLAKDLGAHVTAVDSARKLEMLRTIGADRVIDYAQEDFTEGPEAYDVIFDVVRGTLSARMVRRLTENGCLLMANPGFLQIVRARWASRGSRKRVSFAASGVTNEDLAHLRALIEAGRLRPVIDRRFPLEQTAEAHAVRRDRPEAGERRRRRRIVAAAIAASPRRRRGHPSGAAFARGERAPAQVPVSHPGPTTRQGSAHPAGATRSVLAARLFSPRPVLREASSRTLRTGFLSPAARTPLPRSVLALDPRRA